MATNNVKIVQGSQWLFADHATDFGAAPATAANSLIIGAPTDVQMDLTGLAASGGAREAAKANLGTPRAPRFTVDACMEHETVAVEGETVDFYWAPSPSATAGTGNPGGLTGADAGFTDTASILGQMQHIGTLTLKANVINIGHVGVFSPVYQYGMMVVINNSTKTLRSTATAADEIHIVMTEIIGDIQAAA